MDVLLDIKEASKHLKCSRWTLYRIIKRREISFIRRRRRILFKEHDLETYVSEGRRDIRLNLKETLKNLTKSLKSNHLYSEVSDLASKLKSKTRRNYGYGNGSIYQRTLNGNLWVDCYVNGKRIQKGTDTTCMQEAELILFQMRVKSFDKTNEIEESREKKIGFRNFATKSYHDVYMTTNRRNFKPDVYRLQILCDYFKDRDLRTITPLDWERFKAWLLRRGNKKSTVNRYLQLGGKMLNLAIEEGYLEENVIRKVKLYSEKDNLKERILTEEEEEKLTENCSDILKLIIAFALNTGMRRAEILGLTRSQVDFKNRRIRVEKTKSGKVRFIPINEDLFKLLLKLKSENGQSPFVFLNPATKRPFLDMKTPFKRACRMSGIEGLRFHDLRHTFATRLVAKGVDIETIKELLGHHSIAITQRYLHSSDERKRKAVEILSKKSDETGMNSDKDSDNRKPVELIH